MAHEPKIKYTSKYIPSQYKQWRIVITTNGENPVFMARSDSDVVKEYPVNHLPDCDIKDTNCCGDAFAGGFLAMYIANKSLDECMRCAIYCATECLKQSGCTLPQTMSYK
jgi:adenosine kinase